MATSKKKVDNRASKREKMINSMSLPFGDSLANFKTPTAAREISGSIDSDAAKLEERLRTISNSSEESMGDDPQRVASYIEERASLVDDLQLHLNSVRRVTLHAHETSSKTSVKQDLKRVLKELDVSDNLILRERAALASSRARIEFGMRALLDHIKLGEGYLMALTHNLPAPANSEYKKYKQRGSNDQSSFRHRLIKAYNREGSRLLPNPGVSGPGLIWCPVSRREHDPFAMVAAHIIPHAIGEANATYLFGAKPHEGYNIIWSERNGLMMHKLLKKIFDDGRMVIIPDPSDKNEFISVILCSKLQEEVFPLTGETYLVNFHNRRLEFQTAARPSKRYLYIHTLITHYRRRRHNISGWEKDREHLFTGRIWATPGKWARKSMVEALAVEVGDTWEEDIVVKDAVSDYPDGQPSEEEKKMAIAVRYAFVSRGSGLDNDEDGDEDENEDENEDEDENEYGY